MDENKDGAWLYFIHQLGNESMNVLYKWLARFRQVECQI